MHGLMNVAHPVPQELEGRQLRLVGRSVRCQHSDVGLDRRHHALLRKRALFVAKACRGARDVDEVLLCTLPRPIGPIAGGAKGTELLIQLDQRKHTLAGAVLQLEEGKLAYRLMAEATPGSGRGRIQQQRCRCERRGPDHGNALFCAKPDPNQMGR
jgi:hypothetical protein